MFSSFPLTNPINTSSTDNMIMTETMDIAHCIYKYVATHLPKNFPEKFTDHIDNNFDGYIDSTSYKQTVLYKIFQHAKILILQSKVLRRNQMQDYFTYLLDYFPYEMFEKYTLFPVFKDVIEHSYLDSDLNVDNEVVIPHTSFDSLYDPFDIIFTNTVTGLNSSSHSNALIVAFD